MTIIYALVAKGSLVLAEFSGVAKNASNLARRYVQQYVHLGDSKASFVRDQHVIHILKADGVTFLCIDDDISSKTSSLKFLEEIYIKFFEIYGHVPPSGTNYLMDTRFSEMLFQHVEWFSDSSKTAMSDLMKVDFNEVDRMHQKSEDPYYQDQRSFHVSEPVVLPGILEKVQTTPLVPTVGGPPPYHSPILDYRPVQPSDLDVLQEIHEALFPIRYEMDFFLNVAHGREIVAWVAVDRSRPEGHGDEVIGFITAKIVKATESEDLLGYEILSADRCLVYILTLGVVKPYRNLGIASSLVSEVLKYASRIPSCRAVYLHVISYNHSAIMFYEKNSFRCIRKLSNFYHISGHYYDAYLYVYYVNGGRAPCSALDCFLAAGSFVRSLVTTLIGMFSDRTNIARQPDLGAYLS